MFGSMSFMLVWRTRRRIERPEVDHRLLVFQRMVGFGSHGGAQMEGISCFHPAACLFDLKNLEVSQFFLTGTYWRSWSRTLRYLCCFRSLGGRMVVGLLGSKAPQIV